MPTRIKLPTSLTAATTSTVKLSDCKPCQAARAQALAAADQIALAEDTPAPERVTWSGPIVHEDLMTGDGRFIESNALTWENLPIPLRWVREDTGEHNGAMVVGRITAITRKSGGVIWGEGDFDTGSAEGMEAARQVREDLSRGISVDMDNVSFTIRVAKELLPDAEEIDTEPATPEQEAEVDEDGRVTVLDIDADAEVMVIDDARIRAATLVAVPAFEGARITLDENPFDPDAETNAPSAGTTPDGDPCSCDEDADDYDPDCTCDTDDQTDQEETAAVTAGGPKLPPPAWFTDPGLDGPTALTIDQDGRLFGHLAVWDTCHTGFAGDCVTPPRSPSGYGFFRTGTVFTDTGTEVPVGHITLDTFHANKQLGAADTIAHYEHTGATVADVAAGEDEHGIWVAGAIRPHLTDDQMRALRAAPLSGDWRRIGGQLELVAALAVNVPGFPVPRPQGVLAASGAVRTLVASGVVEHRYNKGGLLPSGTSHGPHIGFEVRTPYLTRDDISSEALDWLRKMTAPQHNRAQAAALSRKVKAARLARRTQSVRSETRKMIKTGAR